MGSFSGVAEALGLPKSTISRRVARLERDLGVVLFSRESDGARLTPAGREARAHGRRVMSEVACLQGQGPRPPTVLRIVVAPELSASEGFLGLLARFRGLYPEVVCEVLCTARRIDLAQERVDIVFRVHFSSLRGSPNLKARTLGILSGGVYAAPDWAAAHVLGSPSELVDTSVVTLSGGIVRHLWTLEHETEGSLEIRVRPCILGSEMPWILGAVEHGLGPCILPHKLAETSVQQGRLVRLFPEWNTPKLRVSLLWLGQGTESERVRNFLDLVPDFETFLGASNSLKRAF